MAVLDASTVATKARALWPHLDVLVPELTTLLARLAAWQDWAEQIAGAPLGVLRIDAVANLVAHMVTWTADGSSPPGAITALSTLSLSASFQATNTPGSDAGLAATKPGGAYLALRASIPRINLPRVVC